MHFGGKIYRAYTVELADSAFSIPQLHRPRLEELLDQNPWAGKTVILSGPAGIGKTTLALQWALRTGKRIQYVTARGIPSNMLLHATPPWKGGELLADIINSFLEPASADGVSTIDLLYSLGELVITPETLVVVDDLHVLRFNWSDEQIQSASEALARLNQATIVAITRSLSDSVLQFFQQRGPVRVLSGNQFYFSEQDVEELSNLQDSKDHLAVAQTFGGWATGVSCALTANGYGGSMLDDYVMNEILYAQRADVQNVVLALADFPKITAPLVLDIFEHLDIHGVSTTGIFNSVPMIMSAGASSDAPVYCVAPGIREAFNRLGTLNGNQALMRQLHRFGIGWYTHHRDFEAARELAIFTGLEQTYLHEIMPLCIKWADDEEWEKIRNLIVGISEVIIAQFPSLAFWRMIADTHAGRWHAMFDMRSHVLDTWAESDDPYSRGKYHQIEAWNSWTFCDLDTCLAHARLAFDMLPETARQDKMMAAITAENAARTLGDKSEIDYWAVQTGRYHTLRSEKDQWWHVNAGFHRADHLATCGDLDGAYQMANRWVNRIPQEFPRSRFRYTLLMFYIAHELGDLELAKQHIEMAGRMATDVAAERELELANALWLATIGDFDSARAALNLDFATIRLRLVFNYHRIHVLAAIEEASGNIELASEILVHWFGDEERWPRYFGEPHHGVQRARILAKQERYTEAIERADRIAQQAERRGHHAIAIAALAITAAAHHGLGEAHLRDQRLIHAMRLAGEESFIQAFSPLGVDVRTLAGELSFEEDHPLHLRLTPPSLTEREQEILQLVAQGYSNTEISQELFISLSTVKNHLASIFRKLGVRNRRDAIQTAMRIGGIQEVAGRS